MKLFFRYLFPITYFQATRLNRWALVAYNGLVEWVPAIALSLYYSSFSFRTIGVVLLSYLAFICIYEIGYITNDSYSESFEENPRGRAEQFGEDKRVVWALIFSRLIIWAALTWLLGAFENPIWLAFYAALLVTFVLHNTMRSEFRTPTFFGLSTYRYFAPILLTVGPLVWAILLPTVLLNNSLYRTTVYLRNKSTAEPQPSPSVRFKFAFYAGCLPLSAFLSFFFNSLLPVLVCIYFVFVWSIYWIASRSGPLLSMKKRVRD